MLCLGWQQRRSATEPFGDFDFGSDALALFEASVDNIFVLKSNYWLNL